MMAVFSKLTAVCQSDREGKRLIERESGVREGAVWKPERGQRLL
jgi:hypothetical protein